jgi:hypothetical protein
LDPKFFATTINKFLHLSAAGVIVGGLIYLRFILLPALDGRPESERAGIWQAAYKKSLRWMSFAFLLLFITGMDNIMRARKTLAVASPDLRSGYWGVFWAKVAFVVLAFVLVHLLMIGAPPFRRIQAGYRGWIGVLVAVSLVIVYLSGYLTLSRLSLIPAS